jgi:hypothetical protein
MYSMSRAGFEPAVPVFERSNTARSLDSATTGTGTHKYVFNLSETVLIETNVL